MGHVGQTLQALADGLAREPGQSDRAWLAGLREQHLSRSQKLKTTMAQAPNGTDGRMHPNKVLAAVLSQWAA